ncbi:hypothetical protein [Methylocella silvestris]|nr:hypothetical protein [Methylocella silvestris]
MAVHESIDDKIKRLSFDFVNANAWSGDCNPGALVNFANGAAVILHLALSNEERGQLIKKHGSVEALAEWAFCADTPEADALQRAVFIGTFEANSKY